MRSQKAEIRSQRESALLGCLKTLTVKNEGTVSVTLTLSAAVPYKIVSVLPTLSPEQSGQVTVRFDPNESGSFTGNVQVRINGGQGSVTSSPLVGVAHKIEVSPATLNFFALVEGPAIQQTLTITNKGTTTPLLTVATDEPFSVDAGLFTLASGESKDVTVQFSPPASGEFSSTISIKLSQVQSAFTVSVKGKSITEAEFFQWLSELSQTEPIDTVIPTETIDVGLLNFRNLTPADIQSLINLAVTEGWDSLLPAGVEPEQWWLRLLQLVYQFFQSGGQAVQSVLSSLQELATQLASGGFDTAYKGLLNDQYFKPFVDKLTEIIRDLGASSLFGGATSSEAAEQAIKKFCELYNDSDYGQAGLSNIFLNFGPAGVFALAAVAKIDPNVADGTGVTGTVFNGLVAILSTQGGMWYQVHPDNTLWKTLTAALLALGEDAAKLDTKANQERFNSTIAALGVTATMASNGWKIYAFRAEARYASLPITLDVVGSTTIGERSIAVFGQFFHAVANFDWSQLDALLRAVRDLAAGNDGGLAFLRTIFPSVINNYAFHSVKDAHFFGVVIAVKEQDRSAVERTIDEVFGSSYCSGRCFAIVIVVDDNNVIQDILVKGNIDANLAEEIAAQIAAQMGFVIGKKMPDSPHMRALMKYLMMMMLLGMIP